MRGLVEENKFLRRELGEKNRKLAESEAALAKSNAALDAILARRTAEFWNKPGQDLAPEDELVALKVAAHAVGRSTESVRLICRDCPGVAVQAGPGAPRKVNVRLLREAILSRKRRGDRGGERSHPVNLVPPGKQGVRRRRSKE